MNKPIDLEKCGDLFAADIAGVFAPPINSPTNSNFPAPIPKKIEEIRAELRLISGTLLRDDADRLRRQELWQRLDQLGVLAWGRQ
jgi:hypothetical protein